MKGIPGGEPDILQPNISNLNLEKIKADLHKFHLITTPASGGVISYNNNKPGMMRLNGY